MYIYIYTLWLFNIAMENGPFLDGLPIKNGWIFHGKLLVITRGYIITYPGGEKDTTRTFFFERSVEPAPQTSSTVSWDHL